MPEFTSPLAVTQAGAYDAIAFGTPPLPDALAALREDLEARLHATLAHLPAAMRQEARTMVEAYSGRAGEFYRLYYQPVWSFLHWLDAPDEARTAQALGLFLHLWDDHLCDGQLATTQLTLQVRTDAWMAYLDHARRLAHQMGADPSWVDAHAATYLPEPIADVDAFCMRFERQIAIWTLVPRLLGPALGGMDAGDDLANVLRAFSNAWRLVDDIQDVEEDVQAGVASAVWHTLNAEGRVAWDACHAQSRATGRLDADGWHALKAQLDTQACIPALLTRARAWLDNASVLAERRGWAALAAEIRAHHWAAETPAMP